MLVHILLAAICAPPGDVDDSVGFVLQIRGNWVIEGASAREVRGGSVLPPGVTIRPETGSAKEKETPSITVAFYTGKSTVITKRTTLPERRDASLASRLWRSVAGHYKHDYIQARARPAVANLPDCLLKKTGEAIDLGPLMNERVPGGHYTLSFRKVVKGTTSNKTAPIELAVSWPLSRGESISAPNVTAGLYEVTVFDEKSDEQAKPWLLILPPSGKIEDDYSKVVALVRTWEDDVSEDAKRAFLRAALVALAEDAD